MIPFTPNCVFNPTYKPSRQLKSYANPQCSDGDTAQERILNYARLMQGSRYIHNIAHGDALEASLIADGSGVKMDHIEAYVLHNRAYDIASEEAARLLELGGGSDYDEAASVRRQSLTLSKWHGRVIDNLGQVVA